MQLRQCRLADQPGSFLAQQLSQGVLTQCRLCMGVSMAGRLLQLHTSVQARGRQGRGKHPMGFLLLLAGPCMHCSLLLPAILPSSLMLLLLQAPSGVRPAPGGGPRQLPLC